MGFAPGETNKQKAESKCIFHKICSILQVILIVSYLPYIEIPISSKLNNKKSSTVLHIDNVRSLEFVKVVKSTDAFQIRSSLTSWCDFLHATVEWIKHVHVPLAVEILKLQKQYKNKRVPTPDYNDTSR